MKNTGNAIADALGHLEKSGIEEKKRMAMVKATLELQQPALEAIKDLRSDMDARFEKLESRWDARFEKMDSRFVKMESTFADLRVESSRRDTWLLIAVISLAATIAGLLFRMQSLTAL